MYSCDMGFNGLKSFNHEQSVMLLSIFTRNIKMKHLHIEFEMKHMILDKIPYHEEYVRNFEPFLVEKFMKI